MPQESGSNLNADSISANLDEGTFVDGRYRIMETIGRGGFGRVYKALQVNIQQICAIKIFYGEDLSASTLRRIATEAKTASVLDHKNIVRSRDSGLYKDHLPYIVFDYFEGVTLERYIYEKGRLTLEEALQIFIPLCSALAYAHEHNVVHRDIKPGNILIAKDPTQKEAMTPKILDFGIAKIHVEMGTKALTLTQTGELLGTPAYMSPEQCDGAFIDSRSDIYSMGCTLFEAITGASPFFASSALEIMMKHHTTSLPPLHEASMGVEFPESIEFVIQRMTAKAPEKRYQYLEKVVEDLQAIQRGEFLVGEARREVFDTPKATSGTSNAALLLSIIIAFIFGTLGGGILVYTNTDHDDPMSRPIKKSPEPIQTSLQAPITDMPRSVRWVPQSTLQQGSDDFHGKAPPLVVGKTFDSIGETIPKQIERFGIILDRSNTSGNDDAGIAKLEKFAGNIRLLILRNFDCSESTMSFIAKLTNLKWLQIQDAAEKQPINANTIANLPCLKNAVVLDVGLVDSVTPIATALQDNRSIQELALTPANGSISQSDVDLLGNLRSLRVLSLKNIQILPGTALSLMPLAKLPDLGQLYIEETVGKERVKELRELKALQRLFVNAEPKNYTITNILGSTLTKVDIISDPQGQKFSRLFDPEKADPAELSVWK